MRKQILKPVCAFLCAAMLLTGCDKENGPDTPSELIVSKTVSETVSDVFFPVSICGMEFNSETVRAVSLSPAVTEIIAELGFSDRLVGRSDYCDYPESSAPTVGSAENPDMDKIIALEPDTLFTLTELSERDIYKLSSAGITVLTLSAPISLESYSALYENIAAAFYGNETDPDGTLKTKQIGEQARDSLRNAASGVEFGNFIYVTEKLTLAGNGTFENAVLSLCGNNLLKTDGYGAAAALSDAPDVIAADSSLDESALRKDDSIAGFLDGGVRVVYLDAARFERPSARTKEVLSPFADL